MSQNSCDCLALLFSKSAAIIVSSGATLHLQDSKLFDNGEFGQHLDMSAEVATGAILLEVRAIVFKLSIIAKSGIFVMVPAGIQYSHDLHMRIHYFSDFREKTTTVLQSILLCMM